MRCALLHVTPYHTQDEVVLYFIYIPSYRSVLQDLRWALTSAKDKDFSIILETLQLSQDALETHPTELAGQLIGRIHGYGAATVAMVTQAKAKLREDGNDAEFVRVVTTLIQMLELLMQQVDRKHAVSMLYTSEVNTIT